MKKKQAKKPQRYAIIANRSYGLYAGVVEKVEKAPDGTLTVEATQVRHVARWFGKTGGITSLAVHGICGPRASESRIGAPASRSTLSGIVNVFDCTAEARATIEAAVQS